LILSEIQGRKANLTLACSGQLVTLYKLDNAISILEGIEQYKLVQPSAGVYKLHLVSQLPDRRLLEEQAVEILKNLYGQAAIIEVIFETDISPESSGKYLISKSLFPIDINEYLEKPIETKENGVSGTHE
jgi:hypothetical protein